MCLAKETLLNQNKAQAKFCHQKYNNNGFLCYISDFCKYGMALKVLQNERLRQTPRA